MKHGRAPITRPTSKSYRAAYLAICEGSQLRKVLSSVEAEVIAASA